MTHHLAAGCPCRTALNSDQGRPRLHGGLAGGLHLPGLARHPVAHPVTTLGGCEDAWCTRLVILSALLNLGWDPVHRQHMLPTAAAPRSCAPGTSRVMTEWPTLTERRGDVCTPPVLTAP